MNRLFTSLVLSASKELAQVWAVRMAGLTLAFISMNGMVMGKRMNLAFCPATYHTPKRHR